MCDPIAYPEFTSPIYKAVGYHPDQTGVSNVGVFVKCGDLIGYADNSGTTSGDHLHFGIKPQMEGEPDGIWYNYAQSNGYMGAVDPTPYWTGETAANYVVEEQIIAKAQAVVSMQQQEIDASKANNVPIAPEESAKVGGILESVVAVLNAILSLFIKGRQ